MSPSGLSRDERERQLEQMTKDEILAAWRKATKNPDLTPAKTVRMLIDETLRAEELDSRQDAR